MSDDQYLEDSLMAKYYVKKPISISRGFMQYVWDSSGNKYLDAHTGFGVAFLGHRNPSIVNAVMNQLSKVITVPLTMYSEARLEFLTKFSRIIPGFGKVFLQNSGAEAVEVALKAARKITGKSAFLSFNGSFHGRTLGALSVTGNERYRKAFEPLPYSVRFAPLNAINQVDKLITEDLAAVIVEPIQGEGGINPAKPEFMRALRQVTSEKGVLLIMDEIQTGFGRTGWTWAFQGLGVEPDIFTAGKSIAGGLPIGVAVVKSGFGDVFEPGEHGSTFAGNPLVMAAAAAGVNVLIEEDVPQKAAEAGKKLLRRLEEIKSRAILRIKGMGLMLGIELRGRGDPHVNELMRLGVLASTVGGGSTIRLLPPFCINEEDIDHLGNALEATLTKENA